MSPAWESFWKTLWRFDREKIRGRVALRNTIGVLIPLIVGGLSRQNALGLVGALGALNVAYSDGEDPYRDRLRRMLLASVLCALALGVGGLAAHSGFSAILIAGVWALSVGLLVAVGSHAADVGTVSLVTLVVFESRALPMQQAAFAGLIALAGSLLQTAISLAFWPVRRYQHETAALSAVYRELAMVPLSEPKKGTAPPASAGFTSAHAVLANGDSTPESERLSALLSQAERIRLRTLRIIRIRRRLLRDELHPEVIQRFDTFSEGCRQALLGVAGCLSGQMVNMQPGMSLAQTALEELRAQLAQSNASRLNSFLRALLRDALVAMESVLGQIRAASQLANRLFAPVPLPTKAVRLPDRFRAQFLTNASILRANLSMRSVAFRHALRLAGCVVLGEAIGRGLDWQRSYWIPMTVAIVLKPDFFSTFTRGAFRLAGTFVGLVLATVLYHIFPTSMVTDIALTGVFTLALRWIGPANYGVFVIAVSGLIVALIANTGIAPRDVIPLRALNTSIGGALALLAYAIWPTWEKMQSGESFARLLDAYRAYVRAIQETLAHQDVFHLEKLEHARQAARVARSNVEASAERLKVEPGSTPESNGAVSALLANSHDFIYSVMTLETLVGEERAILAGLPKFLDKVELTLYFLASLLRGSQVGRKSLPDLRESYRTLMGNESGLSSERSFVHLEINQMVTALNTCTEQVFVWLAIQKTPIQSVDRNLLT